MSYLVELLNLASVHDHNVTMLKHNLQALFLLLGASLSLLNSDFVTRLGAPGHDC